MSRRRSFGDVSSQRRLSSRLTKTVTVFATVVVLVVTGGCSRGNSELRRFPITGTVQGSGTEASRIVVEHDAVTGLMPPMIMDFEVEGASFLPRRGDRIAATLMVTAHRSWLQGLSVTQPASVPRDGLRAGRAPAPGTLAPDFHLIDQDNQPVTRQRFVERVVVLTFIYTRCPLPDFCPLMVRHLERVRHLVNDLGFSARTAFVGVTLDPAFDSPSVLRRYGTTVLKGPDRFEQWTLATGSAAQVADVATFFGTTFRTENQMVTHTLMTAVLDGNGRLVRSFPSNAWRPEELFEVVRQAIDAGRTTL